MSPQYLNDRIPVIPLSVHLKETILAVHVEGEATREVDDGVVDGIGPGEEPGTTRISYVDAAGSRDSLVLRNGSDWVSVALQRPSATPVRNPFAVDAA